MSKTSMPNIPGMEAMSGTLDFVKNLWGNMSTPGMGIPGMIMPTLSVEEINKQITDLKAVESWLTLNMNMLRSTIQALEVQSATISTLQSMGQTLSAAVKTGAPAKESAPFSFAAAEKAPEALEPEPEPEVEDEEEEESEETPPIVKRAFKAKAPPKTAQKAAPTPEAVPLANPALWWNMLQDQFKQAVGTAMASEKVATAPPKSVKKPAAAAKPAVKAVKAKPAAKKAAPARKPKTTRTAKTR